MQNIINISEEIKKRFDGVPVIDRRTALGAINLDLARSVHRRQECISKAQADPLPGESAGAFLHGAIDVCGKKVNRFVPAYLFVLKAIESPLLSLIHDAIKNKTASGDLSDQEQWDLCYIFTNDPKAVFNLVQSEGKKALQAASQEEIGMKWEQHQVEFVINGIFEQYVRQAEAKSKVLTEEAEKNEVRFFREPTPTAKTSNP